MALLRWVLVLPASVLGSWLSWLLYKVLAGSSLNFFGIEAVGFIYGIIIEGIASFIMGIVFVLAGAKTAPNHQLIVGYVLSGIGMTMATISLVFAIISGSGMPILAGSATLFGVIAGLISIWSGEYDLHD